MKAIYPKAKLLCLLCHQRPATAPAAAAAPLMLLVSAGGGGEGTGVDPFFWSRLEISGTKPFSEIFFLGSTAGGGGGGGLGGTTTFFFTAGTHAGSACDGESTKL